MSATRRLDLGCACDMTDSNGMTFILRDMNVCVFVCVWERKKESCASFTHPLCGDYISDVPVTWLINLIWHASFETWVYICVCEREKEIVVNDLHVHYAATTSLMCLGMTDSYGMTSIVRDIRCTSQNMRTCDVTHSRQLFAQPRNFKFRLAQLPPHFLLMVCLWK